MAEKNNTIYQILDSISRKKYKTELKLLSSIIHEIVEKSSANIDGGRIWQLDESNNSYKIIYHTGNIKNIPSAHRLLLSEQSIFSTLASLAQNRTLLTDETDTILIEAGIGKYAMTGCGEIIKLGSGKYFEYLLSFSGENFTDEFFDSLILISTIVTVSLRNLKANAEKNIINKDIQKASEIQRNLLPEHSMEYKDYKIFGLCIPDRGVGGDYFDYIRNTHENDEEQLSIVISDAASKGLPAAIQSLFVSGAIRMGMSFATRISHIFALLNNLIYDTFPSERFVSLFWCELTNSSNRMVLYANAGHCPPIHYRRSQDRIKHLGTTGGLLGIVENQKFGLENIQMHQGDILLLYTDGINEAQDENGNLYGEDRLAELLRKHYNETPKNIAYHIIEDVQKFSANSIYSDDRTLVVIKRDYQAI